MSIVGFAKIHKGFIGLLCVVPVCQDVAWPSYAISIGAGKKIAWLLAGLDGF
jgi:hypothetical protein